MANYQLKGLVHRPDRTLSARRSRLALYTGALFAVIACSEQPDGSVKDQQVDQRYRARQVNLNIDPLQDLVNAQGRQGIVLAHALRLAIEQFLQNPDKTQQAKVQAAWLNAHSAYAAMSSLPLPALLALDSDTNLTTNTLLYQIDAWPIEPGYLDSLPAYPGSGIISDITVPMTAESLQRQHGFTDAQEVSMGFHALEYLIFARERSDFQLLDSAPHPMKSPMKSAIKGTLNSDLTSEVIARRREALHVIAKQISLDLASLLIMNEAGYVNVASDTTEGEKRVNVGLVLSVVKHLRQIALQTIEDNQHLITADIGHGDYSASGQQLLAVKLESLRLTLFDPTNLTLLVAADETGTLDALRDTLQEAQSKAGSETISAVDQVRLTLLLAALPHLLDDLGQLISQPPQALRTSEGAI
jgi:hypothetical protein